MRETIVRCDKCQAKCTEHYVRIRENGGTDSDYYGSGTTTADIELDMCIACFRKMMGKKRYQEHKKDAIDERENLWNLGYLS